MANKITQKQIDDLNRSKDLCIELLNTYQGKQTANHISEIRNALTDWLKEANAITVDWDELSAGDKLWLLRYHLLPVIAAFATLPQPLKLAKSYAKTFINYGNELLAFEYDASADPKDVKSLKDFQESVKWAIAERARFIADFVGKEDAMAPDWSALKCPSGGDYWQYPQCKPGGGMGWLLALGALVAGYALWRNK